MAGKFHLNRATGKVAACHAGEGANPRSCPLGGESGTENHYESAAEAQNAYEKSMADKAVSSVKKTPAKKLSPLDQARQQAKAKLVSGIDKLRNGGFTIGHVARTDGVYSTYPYRGEEFAAALGETLDWKEYETDEYAYQMNQNNIPQESWFRSPGLGIHDGKLLFDSYTGFSVMVQSANAEGHQNAARINRALRDANVSSKNFGLTSTVNRPKETLKELGSMGANPKVVDEVSAITTRWKPTEKETLGVYRDAMEEHQQYGKVGTYLTSRIAGLHFAKESLTERERLMLTDMEQVTGQH